MCVRTCTYVDEFTCALTTCALTTGHLWKPENNLQLIGLSSLLPYRSESLSPSDYPLFFN